MGTRSGSVVPEAVEAYFRAGDVLELDARTIAHAMKDAHQVGSSVVFDFGAGQQITLLNTLLGDLNIKNVIVDRPRT